LIPVMLDLIRAVLPLLDPLLQLATAILTPLIELFGALFRPLIALLDPLIAIATIVIDALVSGALTPLIELLTTLLVPILNVLAEVLLAVVVPPLELLTGLLEGDVTSAFENVGGVLGFFRDVARAVFDFFRDLVRDRIEAVVNAANRIREFVDRVRQFFDSARDAVRDRIDQLVALVRDIPDRIKRASGNAKDILKQAGRNIVQGLIDGIKDMLGRLGDVMGSVAKTVRDFLPFSPAKVGPLSGTGSPDHAGAAIAAMLAEGLRSQIPLVARATDDFVVELRGGLDPRSEQSSGTAAAASPLSAARTINVNITALDHPLVMSDIIRNLEMMGAL